MTAIEQGAMTSSAARPDKTAIQSGIAIAGMLLAFVALLAVARSVHYLLFHTMAELFAIVVSFLIFILTWTSNRYLANGYLIVLGGAYGAIGFVDIFHTLTFRGLNLFPGVSTNHPTQFWLIARYLEALTLLWAPLAISKKPNFYFVSTGFAALAAAACAAVMYQWFPAAFIEGVGLTPFKIYSEYVIIAMLIVGFILLYRFKRAFDAKIFFLLAGSLCLAVATEFCFTRYVGTYDFANELGHYFRFLSVALAFIAVVVSGIRQPLELIFREMDERKRELDELNTKLTASEDRFKRAQRVAKVGSWYLDIATDVLTWSDETYRIFGEPVGTAQSFKTFASHIHPDDLQSVAATWTLARQGQAYDIEHRIVVGGQVRWVREVAEITFGNDGSPLTGLGTVQDITERKLAEVQRAQIATQLRESQKLEALGTLAGGVAHDFNNALAAIIGNVELARQDVGPGHTALVSLDEIGKASRRAKDLVQQILAFGRRQKLERKVMSLALVVVESARLLRATLPATVSLNVDCRGDTPAVLADPAQIKQILLNLCSNALQAVQDQERPGVIEVRLDAYTQGGARGELRPGRYACLTVRDNGPGMDEATRSRIFEPFFTTKPMGKGMGLGLAVVHGIVQSHEASIALTSTPGEGSEFRIYFPAVDAQVPDIIAPNPDATPVHGKGKHVLYVDDEEAIIFLMTRLLQRRGYRVSGYTDPREALTAAQTNPGQFDLAVTDYNMPGMSGLEVARVLREIRPDLPVVLASGYIDEELRAKAPAAGISELIYKPNTADELCEAVDRFANGQGGNELRT